MVFFLLLGVADDDVFPCEINSDRGTETYNINKTFRSKLNIEQEKLFNFKN